VYIAVPGGGASLRGQAFLLEPISMRLNAVRARLAYHMPKKRHQLFRVLEAPLTYVESVCCPAHKLFRVERRVPRLHQEGTKHDIENVRFHGGPLEYAV
jgi:hypothetical protein